MEQRTCVYKYMRGVSHHAVAALMHWINLYSVDTCETNQIIYIVLDSNYRYPPFKLPGPGGQVVFHIHVWAKRFEVNFSIRKTFCYICTRWVNSSSQLVNLIDAWFCNETPYSMASISLIVQVMY